MQRNINSIFARGVKRSKFDMLKEQADNLTRTLRQAPEFSKPIFGVSVELLDTNDVLCTSKASHPVGLAIKHNSATSIETSKLLDVLVKVKYPIKSLYLVFPLSDAQAEKVIKLLDDPKSLISNLDIDCSLLSKKTLDRLVESVSNNVKINKLTIGPTTTYLLNKLLEMVRFKNSTLHYLQLKTDLKDSELMDQVLSQVRTNRTSNERPKCRS